MVNNQIKKLRTKKGLSQGQLAEKANLSIRTIQRVESGNDVSISTLSLIAGALDVEVSELFDEEISSQQQEQLHSLDSQLQYQLHERRKDYSMYSQIYSACYVALMIICAVILNYLDNNDNDNLMLVVAGIWVIALAIMKPLKGWVVSNKINPKLDSKYPLTINRIDKNKESAAVS